MNILGISAGAHDAGITLLRDEDIIFASHSERFSRIKHDSNIYVAHDSPAINIIEYATSLLPEEDNKIDRIAYYERPYMRYLRQIRTGEKYIPKVTDFSIKSLLPEALQNVPIDYHNHHKSHAASAFQTSTFGNATCVVIDAVGEFDTISIWNAEYRYGIATYKKLWGKSYPNSIGLMYSAFTERVGLDPMVDEYILMGMAAYGNSREETLLRNDLLDDDLNFKHNLHVGLPDNVAEGLTNFDLAASGQALTEKLIMEVFGRAATMGYSKNICYSGGVALNCVANGNLLNLFDNVWIMPNPGDAGASLGAAALTYNRALDWNGPYLGFDIHPYTQYPIKHILHYLLGEQIVGVAHGRAEFGPRALGNRSLLADPRGPDIKDRVNEIKQRQKFRPFAPVIREEDLAEYFDMPHDVKSSPYMQYVGYCKKPNEFPAIVHADGTSRVQTVTKEQHSGLYKLLTEWKNKTGCAMLLNTSLNVRGEPMANSLCDGQVFGLEYGVHVIS